MSMVIRAGALILLVACLAAVYFTIRIGMADYYSQQGYDVMASWDSDNPMSEASWQHAFDLIEEARNLSPSNPVFPQRHARLHRMKVTNGFVKAQAREDSLQQAIEDLDASLTIRPFWPSAWAELAYVRWLRVNAGADYEEALTNANRYGPWEPMVIRVTVLLGRRDQAYLFSHGYQDLVLDAYVRGLRSSVKGLPKDILRQLKSHRNVQRRVIGRLVPYLIAPWPRGKSNDFFELIDWGWDKFDTEAHDQIMTSTMNAVSKFRTPRFWVSSAKNEELRSRVCEGFKELGKGDGLERWCG